MDNINKQSCDETYLAQIIAAIKILLQASKEQMIGIKDIKSHIIYYSDSYADFLGITTREIIGKKNFSALYDNPNIEDIILREDRSVIESKKQARFLKINRVNSELKPYVCIKSPLLNSSGDVIGIMLQGLEISVLNFNQQIVNSYKYLTSEASANDAKLPYLSHRERQVIFFFMNQLTSQEIAEMVYKIEGKKISKSTIDSVFNDQLYIKFNVYSRIALLEKLQYLGFGKLIPTDILSSSSTPIDVIKIF